MAGQLIKVHVPEYHLKSKLNYLAIGRKVDAKIEKSLPDGRYVYRAIGKEDHPGLSASELVNIILKNGTDKYDPKRKEVCFESFCMYDHDMHAGCFEVKNSQIVLDTSYEIPSLFGDTVKKFFENVLLDRGYRVRIDLLIIYDAHQMERAKKKDPRKKGVRQELEECLFKFKDPGRKTDALVAIVRINR